VSAAHRSIPACSVLSSRDLSNSSVADESARTRHEVAHLAVGCCHNVRIAGEARDHGDLFRLFRSDLCRRVAHGLEYARRNCNRRGHSACQFRRLRDYLNPISRLTRTNGFKFPITASIKHLAFESWQLGRHGHEIPTQQPSFSTRDPRRAMISGWMARV
jgi:hypothetical protein